MKSQVDFDHITENELDELRETVGGPCISVYLSRDTHALTDSPAVYERRIDEVARELVNHYHLPEPEVAFLLAPAWRLAADFSYWTDDVKGIAIFASARFFKSFRLPVTIGDHSAIADRFDTQPIEAVKAEWDACLAKQAVLPDPIRLLFQQAPARSKLAAT